MTRPLVGRHHSLLSGEIEASCDSLRPECALSPWFATTRAVTNIDQHKVGPLTIRSGVLINAEPDEIGFVQRTSDGEKALA